MKKIAPYLRIVAIVLIAWVIIEWTDQTDDYAIINQPLVWIWLGIVFVFALAIELCVAALSNILFLALKPDAQERYLQNEKAKKEKVTQWFRSIYLKLVDSTPVDEEEEIILDHNYDGIKELDNNLPPWWVYSFYVTIIFGVIYLVRFHVFNDYDQEEEYLMEVAEAQIEIEEYKKNAKDLIDVNTVMLLTEASDLTAGGAIFAANCVACHKADGGGGIGPNLTDDYWIMGGGIKNVFRTISEGGRDGKGMVAWKQTLKPSEMAQVASYVISLGGSTPAEPKEAEGEIWIDPDSPNVILPEEGTHEAVIDSLQQNVEE
ncbi:cbb3-type cytochrome c oxidase N-terminal domain-containing protein [Aquimarina brevivitae]|uniref:Cytochrome c oxidase cbb3-type subunit 3 n=1 Tax=Aquimarina brevivitae TaxID=323412 RepID=A0A4Q7PIP1_9FLAO|nr:cbb3-type cytochrome c oxidase N-terminal domain-containing protein [Aquimarina brevivitae]RZS99690.1 cytochrome c oxidase cbb3-type subunit 3 [Aquimarina brevivitae]